MSRKIRSSGGALPTRATPLLAVALLFVVGCEDEPAEEVAPDPGAPEAQMEPEAPPPSPDADELAAHELSVDELERWVSVHESVVAIQQEDPEIRQRIEGRVQETTPGPDGVLTLDDQAEVIGSEPAYVEALEEEGFTPREFAVTGMVFTAAHTGYEMEEAGQSPEFVEHTWPWLTEEQVAFVRENRETLEPLIQRYIQATQELEGEGAPGE